MIADSAVQSSTWTLFTLLAMITHSAVQSSIWTLFTLLAMITDSAVQSSTWAPFTKLDTTKAMLKPYVAIIASNVLFSQDIKIQRDYFVNHNNVKFIIFSVFPGISPTPAYKYNKGKDLVQAEFKKQCDVFKNKVDFVLGEVRLQFGNFVTYLYLRLIREENVHPIPVR